MNSNREHLERMVSLRKSIRLVLIFRPTDVHGDLIEILVNSLYPVRPVHTWVAVVSLRINLSNITGLV